MSLKCKCGKLSFILVGFINPECQNGAEQTCSKLRKNTHQKHRKAPRNSTISTYASWWLDLAITNLLHDIPFRITFRRFKPYAGIKCLSCKLNPHPLSSILSRTTFFFWNYCATSDLPTRSYFEPIFSRFHLTGTMSFSKCDLSCWVSKYRENFTWDYNSKRQLFIWSIGAIPCLWNIAGLHKCDYNDRTYWAVVHGDCYVTCYIPFGVLSCTTLSWLRTD